MSSITITHNANTTILQHVEDGYGASNNKSLAGFNAINAGNDVDGICAEDSQHSHIHIVQHSYSHSIPATASNAKLNNC